MHNGHLPVSECMSATYSTHFSGLLTYVAGVDPEFASVIRSRIYGHFPLIVGDQVDSSILNFGAVDSSLALRAQESGHRLARIEIPFSPFDQNFLPPRLLRSGWLE